MLECFSDRAIKGSKRDTKILVVEDNVALAFIVQQILEVDGHKVMWAGDGAAGYGTYLLFRPDLIITDIEMPEKDGLEMMAHVRAHNPGIGAIYMSADLDRFRFQLKEEKKRYQVGLLQKPFSRKELMRLISEQGVEEGACGKGGEGRERR